MTKEEALSKTKAKFTNLLDGKTLPNISVSSVIEYYESLLNDNPISVNEPLSNIDINFLEAAIDEMEQDYYDGEDDLPW